MPTTKNAYLRYRTLDRLFRDGSRKYSFKDLLNKVNEALRMEDSQAAGVAVRQLRNDIKFFRSLEGFDAPLETINEGKFSYYTYSDKNFSIGKQPLHENEAEQLKGALEMLGRFDGAPQFEWLSETVSMLTQRFNLTNQSKKVMGFESNIDYTGYKYIAPIFNAIVNKRVLQIAYKPFGVEVHNLEFHPSYLKQYNNR
ncbi:MAG: WYL domain-containing protein, partial [Flavobacteriales bacterium]|nr:WYL domain-containing protein [Flavobacteriales bacterium]